MRKVLAGLALLAPSVVGAQTVPVRGQSGYDTGAIVNCLSLDGVSAARCLMPGVIIYDSTGTPLGTATNPLTVTGGTGGGGSTPTGTAGNPNAAVVTVQGITGGTPQNVAGNAGNTIDTAGTGTLALGTLNSTYTISLANGRGVVGLRISGLSGSGATITVRRSNDGGTTYTNANTTESSATSSLSSALTVDGQPRVNASGATNIQLIVTTAGTGTASIAYNATTSTGGVFMTSLLPSTTTPGTGVIGGVNNQLVAGNTISVGAGTTDTGTQRVSLATDGTYAKSTDLAGLPGSVGYKTNATSLATVNPKAATETTSNVTAATTSTLALNTNAARIGCNIVNDSTSVAYVKLSSGASSTSYTYYMGGSVSGVPSSFACPTDWTGPVYIISATANGTYRISERTN